jgi:hypothetical protein
MSADRVGGCLGLLGPFSHGPTSENVVAIFIQHEHKIRPTELASLTQFGSKDLGLTYRKFRTRQSVSVLIRKNFRTIKDMEEVSHRLPNSSEGAGVQ